MYRQNQKKVKKVSEPWIVYILQCSDSTFYTGITNNLERRFKEHSEGRGARYTRTRIPLKIIYQESCFNRSEALVRECAVKSLSRKQKENLLKQKVKETS